METNQLWDWRLTVPKTIKMTLETKFTMAVCGDGAVPALAPSQGL